MGRLGKILEMRKCIEHKEANQVVEKRCLLLAASLKFEAQCIHQAIVMSGIFSNTELAVPG